MDKKVSELIELHLSIKKEFILKSVLKNLSDTKVEMTITLGAEDLAIAEQVAVTKLSKNVKVAGFRKGKAPIGVASKAIDPNLLQSETINNALSKSVSEAFLENEVQALDTPKVEVKKFVPSEILEFTAETEILPKIMLGDYKKLKVTKEKIEVSDSEVDEIIGRIQSGFAEKKAVDRAAKVGDETTIDFIGKKDGVAFDGGTGSDYALNLGSHQFIPGFEEGIVGHKAGETFDLVLRFPDDYHSADLKGAKVTFTTTIKEVKEVVLPETNDEFAAKAGPFKTIKELTDDIKRELTSQKKREAKEKQKDELVKQLVSISKVPVPEILVDDQMKSIEQDFTRNLMYQGMDLEQYLASKGFKDKDEWLKSEVRETAVSRVQSGLVLGELSKVEKIEASTKELEEHTELYRKQYANNLDVLKQFDLPEVQRDLAARLITEKTVDRLVELNAK